MKMLSSKYVRSAFCCFLLFILNLSAQEGNVVKASKNGIVGSAHPLASAAGLEMLKKKGNAVDAAVATGFALSVVEQYSSGLGGGSLILIRVGETGQVIAIDGRETAPIAAKRDMYVRDGSVQSDLSLTGILAGGVPGTVKALALALSKYGTLPLDVVLAPAIRYAEQGFELTQRHVNAISGCREKLSQFAESARIYLPNGRVPAVSSLFRQPDLARTLKLIATEGADVFYRGEVAQRMVAFMEKHGGLITLQDLEIYEAKERQVIHGIYRGYDIFSMPPPSSGGIHVVQILNILEAYDLSQLEPNSTEFVHLLAEAMKLAFADRAHFLGDSDFVAVPIKGLISKSYAKERRQLIQPDQAMMLESHGNPMPVESDHTTHFSVLDQDGNAVSITQTVNTGFGSGMVVERTGIILNNEMDDFSAQPGMPNVYGLVGAEANAIAPKKRPLSSMSPTIITKDDQPFMVIGSPGGPRIITTVVQIIINVIDFGMEIQAAIDAPRLHHQWKPDRLRLEKTFATDIEKLSALGHQVNQNGTWSAAHGIVFDAETGKMYGGADYRIVDGTVLGW